MKRILLIATVIVAGVPGFAQLTKLNIKDSIIGHAGVGLGLRMQIVQTVAEGDTSYSILYHNADYQLLNDWQSIPFKGRQTINDFYLVLRDAFKKKKGEESTIILGDVPIKLHTDRQVGMKMVWLYCGNGTTAIYKRDLKYLFNLK